MKRPEYMRLTINIIPQEIINWYNLKYLEEGGYIYCGIVKGMYVLPQAVKLSNDILTSRLDKCGYYPCQLINPPPARETDDGWTRSTPPKVGRRIDGYGQATMYRRQ